jgi:hypothetical protein
MMMSQIYLNPIAFGFSLPMLGVFLTLFQISFLLDGVFLLIVRLSVVFKKIPMRVKAFTDFRPERRVL